MLLSLMGVWLHVPSGRLMFEEEGVVAGFCSGFCRACGLALNDMAAVMRRKERVS